MGNLTDATITCSPYAENPKTLITCDYVDNGGWTDAYTAIYMCNGKTGACEDSPVENPLACMRGKNHPRLRPTYKGINGYIYCVSATETQETMGTDGGVVPPGGEEPGVGEE